MEINHISDYDIQRYSLTPAESADHISLHIRSCAQCMEQVNIYKRIFEAIGALSVASIDMEAITRSLPETPPVTNDNIPVKLLVIISVTALLFIVFTMLLLFNNRHLDVTGSEFRLLYLLILTFAVLTIIFGTLDYFRRYRSMMNVLKNS